MTWRILRRPSYTPKRRRRQANPRFRENAVGSVPTVARLDLASVMRRHCRDDRRRVQATHQQVDAIVIYFQEKNKVPQPGTVWRRDVRFRLAEWLSLLSMFTRSRLGKRRADNQDRASGRGSRRCNPPSLRGRIARCCRFVRRKARYRPDRSGLYTARIPYNTRVNVNG